MRLGGAVRSIQVANPAPGVEWQQVVPAGVLWVVLSACWSLIASAVAANRRSRLSWVDGGNIIVLASPNVAQVASTTVVYTAPASVSGAADPNNSLSLLLAAPGEVVLRAGGRLQSSTPSLQGADQYQAINLLVEEYRL